MYLHEANSRDDIFPGGILVPQTFGGMANWNPHVHALIIDTCWDREGNCYPMPEIDSSGIPVEQFEQIVLMLSSFSFKALFSIIERASRTTSCA